MSRAPCGLGVVLLLATMGCEPDAGVLSLESGEAVVTVEPDPFRLVVEATDGVRVAQAPAVTFLDEGGAADELTTVASTTVDGETLRVLVATSSGGQATVELSWTGDSPAAFCLRHIC